jgi:hypothetical protein
MKPSRLLPVTLLFLLAACSPDAQATATQLPTIPPTSTSLPSATRTPSPLPSPTASLSPLPTQTPSPTATATATIIPTYTILRGEVLELSNCRYGPGAVYLYKYGLLPGSNLEVIGRSDAGDWILVQAIGGHNPCWLKASLMKIKGDVMSVAPTEYPLPLSPYYGPPTGVSAQRKGSQVTVSWKDVPLRAGDDESYHYLIEAWLCAGGKITFTPIGTYDTSVTLTDEPGCASPSHARLYTAEKHGYSRYIEIPWPPAVAITTGN